MTRAALVLAAFLGLAAPAQAGTITSSWDPKFGGAYAFTAAPGERNQVTIEPAGKDVRITDTAGAPTGECVPESPTAVRCPGSQDLFVDTGDGDDTVVNHSDLLGSVYGGPGNDRLETTTATRLVGGDGDDTLVGSPGHDRLDGGPGRDRMSGGRGDDRFLLGHDGREPVPDVVSGGAGSDTANYFDRTDDLRIDLARGRGPDGDVFESLERAIGGSGDDVLIGDAQGNRLEGRFGKDRIDGGAGDDKLIGQGEDTLIGRAGDDYFSVEAGAVIRCGAGRDRVWADEGTVPRIPAGCERVASAGPVLHLRPGRLRATWDDGASYGRPCRLRVTVDGRRVVAGRWVPARRPATVRIAPVGMCDPDYDQLPPAGVFRLL
ncbi:hypothetical protein OJ997_25975 [Solirubrobacter phytolaccae]|uniref:Calcium-binding protein n=1 Tax=Solirubrobacter phytolaccae TaxID=1404360 RepID=A0A9X3SI34_9ACTN|nr:calcium-binding protein [Solirubrobacter phytolaccae]MDA0183782.1 hypothetical protein [Solirubrobacter phytolaccae]